MGEHRDIFCSVNQKDLQTEKDLGKDGMTT
jgi:hypothetical protein